MVSLVLLFLKSASVRDITPHDSKFEWLIFKILRNRFRPDVFLKIVMLYLFCSMFDLDCISRRNSQHLFLWIDYVTNG